MERRSLRDQKIAVSCVLWQGDFRSRNYSAEWVYKLYRMVQRNLDLPFDFVCFSNVPLEEPVIKKDLTGNLNGWWAKMEQFTALQEHDLVLSLDLDLFIMQPLEPLLEYAKDCPVCFAPQTETNLSETDKEGKRRVQNYRTGTLVYKPQILYGYGLDFMAKHEIYTKKYRGDQDWWGDKIPNARTLPKEWFCKTRDILNEPDKEVKIVFSNHIKNDEAVKKWEWARKIWT